MRSKGRRGSRAIGAILLAGIAAGCGVPITSGSQFGTGVDPSEPLTFAWNQDRDLVVGDPRLTNNQFFEDRLHEAVEWELSLRGFRRVDESPDLLIHHHLSLADHEMIQEIIGESGASSTEVYSFEEGSVVVHMTDTQTGRAFWVGMAQANIEPALAGPDAMREWVNDLVRVMFREWPMPERAQ